MGTFQKPGSLKSTSTLSLKGINVTKKILYFQTGSGSGAKLDLDFGSQEGFQTFSIGFCSSLGDNGNFFCYLEAAFWPSAGLFAFRTEIMILNFLGFFKAVQ